MIMLKATDQTWPAIQYKYCPNTSYHKREDLVALVSEGFNVSCDAKMEGHFPV